MKKLIAVIASLAVLALCACSADVEESTTLIDETEAVSETTATEETTRRNPTIHEMSPASMNTEPYVDVEKNTAKIKFSSFKEISSEDSYLKIKELDKILKGTDREYYFLNEENKVLMVLFDENGELAYSASYSMETGALEFLGDDAKTWYFNEDGALRCMVYEYNDESGYSGIYTFYTPEGKRDLVRVGTFFYDSELFELSENDTVSYLQKYSYTIEIVSQ